MMEHSQIVDEKPLLAVPTVLMSERAASPAATTIAAAVPIPMSFPAILRVSGRAPHLSHPLYSGSSEENFAVRQKRSDKRDEKEGKRWIRRKENARFADNPYVVHASKKDFAIPTPHSRPTFPQPLPTYLSRNTPIPATVPTVSQPVSASAGQFSMGIRGVRKQLRKSGPRAQLLVEEIEAEIMGWLANNIWLNPESGTVFEEESVAVGTSASIIQVSRTFMQLVWAIADDSFARYVVHCCARYHNIVSFSKDVSGRRLTYILRPNITRPTFEAPQGLNTPAATDLESSALDSESDFLVSDRGSHASVSDIETDSDLELGPGVPHRRVHPLAEIPESNPVSPALRPSRGSPVPDDSWSIVNESDADADVEHDLARSVASLDLDADTTTRAARQLRQGPSRSYLWERQHRAASSPSRSPARNGRNPPRLRHLVAVAKPKVQVRSIGPKSFYDYLFA